MTVTASANASAIDDSDNTKAVVERSGGGDTLPSMKVTFNWLKRNPGGGLFTTKKQVLEVHKGYEFVMGLLTALRVGETPIYSSKGDDWKLRDPQDRLSDTIEYGLIEDQAYGKTLYQMRIPEELFALPLKLEEFARRDLHFIGPDVDMRFTNGDYLPVTPVGYDLIENFAKDKKSVILFGKSGCRKTTAIFDAAQVYPCLLFTASSYDRDNERRADPGSKDLSFEALEQDVARAIEKPSDYEKKNETDKLILALVLARLLMLLVFQEKCTKDTAKHWLVYQLTEHMHHITLKLYNSLKQRSSDKLSALEREINLATDGDFYFYAFDEAQFG
ncbi:expressed unknown protein [Seminavis robusta]|uniref:Uncharacterized protein n=1 Tax=Seminavis robusta TaxID=568900 RepID=A0A9N8EYA2_9STRA|nr:expressed unknown protein [Seminavis robusta]|eukprot:Sro2068_g313320.1 n/a (332) ;mRNA; r:4227-5376